MSKYVLAIDQGTTGTTSVLFDADLNIKGKTTLEFPQHFPKPSWVEHDLDEIWKSVVQSVRDVLEQTSINGRDIVAIGIANQRETSCIWRRDAQGTPLSRAIVWQDRRTAKDCQQLRKDGMESVIRKKTGLLLDPYFSATKLRWLLKNVPGAIQLDRKGQLAFGTIESFLLYRMSGEHRTDVSNASRTLLMNIHRGEWDKDLLKIFQIPPSLLPEILGSAVHYGTTRGFDPLPDGIPITGLAGDQQAALFGQTCFSRGAAKCTYGTGAFIIVNTGEKPVYSKERLLTTIAWKLGNKTTYGLEGSAFIAGAAVQWLRDGLQTIPKSSDIEYLAAGVPDSDGVTFVPALSGMGAPHWIPEATGLITGITRRTTKAHLARATLDGIAFQIRELVEAMRRDFGKPLRPIKVDGGASVNNLLMQFQADLLGVEVVRSKIMETTALGAALQAGLGVGLWTDLGDIQKKWQAAEHFFPNITPRKRAQEIERWERAVKAVKLLSLR